MDLWKKESAEDGVVFSWTHTEFGPVMGEVLSSRTISGALVQALKIWGDWDLKIAPIAEMVSDRLDGDGSRTIPIDHSSPAHPCEIEDCPTCDGGIEALCRQYGASVHYGDGGITFTFDDDSSIYSMSGGWDVVHPECVCGKCWVGSYDEPECLEEEEEEA